MNYSPELKEALLRRMLPPNNESISKISKEEGISEQTLRNWRDKARADGIAAPGKDALPDEWSTQDKFLIVVETASMNETELAEYARKKGLYVEQIKAWRDACMSTLHKSYTKILFAPFGARTLSFQKDHQLS